MKVFLNTQMRVGSTWMGDILSKILGKKWNFWAHGGSISKKRFRNRGNGLIKLHWANPKTICDAIEKQQDSYQISLTRNLYDIIISSIFYMRYDKPLMKLKRLKSIQNLRVRFGIKNKHLNDKDFVNKFIQEEQEALKRKFIDPWIMYNNGYKHPKYRLFYYEEMKEDVLSTINEVCEFLNVKKKRRQKKRIANQCSFKNKTGRKAGKENTKKFRRKGIVGDYKNYMTQESIQIIKKWI